MKTTKPVVISRRSPIYRDSAFVFENIEQSEQAFDAEHRYPQSGEQLFYTRYGNPNVIETEQEIARLEGSDWALLTASGMAAIDVALSLFHERENTGTWLFFEEIYGGTKDYIKEVLEARRGIRCEYFKTSLEEEKFDLMDLKYALDHLKPKLLYFEPVSNPLLIVANGNEIIRLAKERGIRVIIDNTFATPALWKPLERGADLVIHSVTKYLSGHGNITAGVVCGNNDELHKAALTYRKFVGHILSPDDAYRLGTQLKTFELRVTRQCENALKLANLLEGHEQVKNVRYPGLAAHATHQEALNIFGKRGFGAMVTFELKGGQQAVETFIAHAAPHVKYVTSLGDPQSIMIHVPTIFSAERFPFPGMIRFSVGFEAYHLLEESVTRALGSL